MIKMLLSDEADIAAASLSRTWERDSAVTFGISVMEGEYILIAPQRKTVAINIWVYMEIMTGNTWALCGAMTIIFAIAFTIINVSGTNNLHQRDDSEGFSIINGMGVAIMFILQQTYTICLRSVSSRMLFVTAAFGSYFLFVYYSADLTARMTLVPPPLSIKSFGDVIQHGYDVITFEASSWHGLLKTALPGTAMSQVFKDKMEGDPNYIIEWVKADEAADILYTREKTLLFASIFYALGSDNLVALDTEVSIIDGIKSYRSLTYVA